MVGQRPSEHSASQRFQIVASIAKSGHDWVSRCPASTSPICFASISPTNDAATVAATLLREVVRRLIDYGHTPNDPYILIVYDAGTT
jgi:hypothetical protein